MTASIKCKSTSTFFPASLIALIVSHPSPHPGFKSPNTFSTYFYLLSNSSSAIHDALLLLISGALRRSRRGGACRIAKTWPHYLQHPCIQRRDLGARYILQVAVRISRFLGRRPQHSNLLHRLSQSCWKLRLHLQETRLCEECKSSSQRTFTYLGVHGHSRG